MIAWQLLFNALLLAGLGWWLRRAHRQAPPELRRWLLPALAWRLLLTAAAARWPSPDAIYLSKLAYWLAIRLAAHPGHALALLQRPVEYFSATGPGVEVYRWSQSLFFEKLVALLYVGSGGALWLNTLYFSLGCFVAFWSLVVALRRALPAAPPQAAGLAFLLWPTVLWWSAGLNKETVLLGCGAGIMALALPMLYGPASQAGRPWPAGLARLLAMLLLAWVFTRVRYFFALPLLGGLLALAGVRAATRRGWLGVGWPAQVGGVLLGLLLLLALAEALGGELLTPAFFVREVNLNYHHGLLTSPGRPRIEYGHWQPTVAGLLAHAPLAVAETLTRPWPGETAGPQYIGASLENAVLTALVLLALARVLRGRPGPLPVALVVVLIIYCLLLAAFIGLSTPNLGTLNRYRAVLLPWLLWLCLARDGGATERIDE